MLELERHRRRSPPALRRSLSAVAAKVLAGATLLLIETSGTFELEGEKKAYKRLRQKLWIRTLQLPEAGPSKTADLGRAGEAGRGEVNE